MPKITVQSLHIHPVKSLKKLDVPSLNLLDTGPEFDRQWMVVDANNRFVTQRKLAKMCRITPVLRGGHLSLQLDRQHDIQVPRGGKARIQVTVWNDQIEAEDCGDEIAEWFSDALNKPCRLVYLARGNERTSPLKYTNISGQLAFADAYPLLLATQSSLDDFNTHLSSPVGMDRFRPNIVLKGNSAYAEDGWRQIRIAGNDMVLVSPCTRCVMPSIDPETGKKQAEVLDALNAHRRFGTKTHFGQNVVYPHTGVVSVGDEVTVIA